MGILHNNSKAKSLRQLLRSNISPVESLLWLHLKGKGMLGYKFRRQHGVGPYVMDYYCPALRLAIEVDGDSHYTPSAQLKDVQRTEYLNECNVIIIRFTNKEVLDNIDGVIEMIRDKIVEVSKDTTPNPSL